MDYLRFCLAVMVVVLLKPLMIESQLVEDASFQLLQYRPAKNLEIVNDTVIVGAKNRIMSFDQNLKNLVRFYNTCESVAPGAECENVNKVMLLNEKDNQLILCGTGKDGICEIVKIPDYDVHVSTTQSDLAVSVDVNRLAIGIISGYPNFTIAVTNGIGPYRQSIYHGLGEINTYAISKRKLADFSSFGGKIFFDDGFKDYVIFYKDGFHYENYSYFVTNLNKSSSARNMISKLVRICPRASNLNGYVDFEIGCRDNEGKDYNLIQKVVYTKLNNGDMWIIGIFSRGEDAERPGGGTVLCSTKLQTVAEKFNETWYDYYTCYKNMDTSAFAKYLKNNRINNDKCEAGLEGDYKEGDFDCETLPSFYYNIGFQKLTMTYNYKMDTGFGYATAAHLTHLSPESESHTVVILGSSDGKLAMLNVKMKDGGLVISKYSDYSLDVGVPVTAIRQKDDDTLYVLNEKKVHKLSSTNCSEFSTCQKTMDGNNPLCGWCVRESRATRKGYCSEGLNEWLSALDGNCPSLTPVPRSYRIDSGKSKTITIEVSNVPVKQGDEYECVFKIGEQTQRQIASRNDPKFSCSLPSNVSQPTQAMLELVIKPSITVATTKFTFYRCSQYKTCGECVGGQGSDCNWNQDTVNCEPDGSGTSSKTDCPMLSDGVNFIPSGIETEIELPATNLSSAVVYYKCLVNGQCISGSLVGSSIKCSINMETNENKTTYRVYVKYGRQMAGNCSNMITMDDSYENTVTVYNCEQLADGDSTRCCALKDKYQCDWDSGSCKYSGTGQCDGKNYPDPIITNIQPNDGPSKGGTSVTLVGKHFGSWVDLEQKLSDSITFGGSVPATPSNYSETIYDVQEVNEDFDWKFPRRIVCKAPSTSEGNTLVNVTLKIGRRGPSKPVSFEYKVPNVTEIVPDKGPIAGGTRITIKGKNLVIGNEQIDVEFNNLVKCTDIKPEYIIGKLPQIVCLTGKTDTEEQQTLKLELDGQSYQFRGLFSYVKDPEVDVGEIQPKRGFSSGGTEITVKGENLDNAGSIRLSYVYDKQLSATECKTVTSKLVICTVPKAVESLKNDLKSSANKRRKKRSAEECLKVTVALNLDGIRKEFKIEYCRDPVIEEFDNKVLLYKSGDKQISIKGQYLNLVATEKDFKIKVGVSECAIISLTDTEIICVPPHESPVEDSSKAPVNVTVGNIKVTVGYLEYQKDVELAIILGAIGGVVAVLIVVGAIVAFCLCKKVDRQAKKYQDDLKAMEMEIIDVARQEFLDMHTTMSSVNKNLIEQGFPYHTYQQYACNIMFAVDYLWTEPVMTDSERSRANKGMQALESLMFNKFFLVSVIGTMEKQKRFFIREKSNLAGNLCAVLMGRMDHLHEVLQMLITNLVQDSMKRKTNQKALFRRCESITEKLLSNWMSLCLYPHFKNTSGSPLYYLYMVLQKTIESGPIDAVTGDSKFTLSEEKLLKKIGGSGSLEDLKFESKTLTLNVVVNNGDEIFKCKVLDCDTISQVKCKCLSQIYVNYPASKLNIDPDELILEWHEGFGGTLRLQDHDNTSKQEGLWMRLNTLAHYNVKDDSNMALVDTHVAESRQQDDYVNLTQVNMDVGGCNGSMDSSDPLTSPTLNETDQEFMYWHLVKKEEESTRKEKSVIAELYLNRLFKTKLSVKDYLKAMFDVILDKDKCPEPAKFLLGFMDDLGDQFKVDSDTIHSWKSQSYAIRVWAALMKLPSLLFDVKIPSYMNDNLEVISQVFIESFSLSSQKFTKDSPSQKLIFHNEMVDCRQRALEFYKNVKADSQNPEEFRQCMFEVNRLQQETHFNKTSALYRFYNQLKPYLTDIVEDLATSKETKDLKLDQKLERVMAIMEAEDDS